MTVYCLFSDVSASELSLELCAPDPGGNPVQADVIGAEDRAMRTSADRAVRCGYFLLRDLGVEESVIRCFASFDMSLPADQAMGGDSAGLAFLVRFLATMLAKDGTFQMPRPIAATGVIAEGKRQSAIAPVESIPEKLWAVREQLPGETAVLLPRENLEQLRQSGEWDRLPPDLQQRIVPLANTGELLTWLRQEWQLAPPQKSRHKGPFPLWLQRLALYGAALGFGPVVMLMLSMSGVPGVAKQEAAPAPEEPTGKSAPLPGVAPRLTGGYVGVRLPNSSQPRRFNWAGVNSRRHYLGELSPGTQIHFRETQLDQDGWFYLFACGPPEAPYLAALFPSAAGEDKAGNPAENPLSAEKTYSFPSRQESFGLDPLPEGVEKQQEFLYIVTSAAPLPELMDLRDRYMDLVDQPDKKAEMALVVRKFLLKVNSLGKKARVLQLEYHNVSQP